MHRAISLLTLASLAGAASAQNVTVTVENMLDTGNFSFTPVWMAMHNGGFDSYNGGELASLFPGLEELAEGGDTGPISTAFTNSPAGIAGGVQTTLVELNGAPVFGPGESNSVSFDVGDATVNRYFSYASMIVPSNDLFVANGNPTRFEVFDAGGNYNGPVEILILGNQVKDAGTEVNDAFGGAAFSANGGDSVDENVVIRSFFGDPDDQAYLDSFIGTDTVDGGTITGSFGPDDVVARITVTPAPASLAMLSLGGLCLTRRRR